MKDRVAWWCLLAVLGANVAVTGALWFRRPPPQSAPPAPEARTAAPGSPAPADRGPHADSPQPPGSAPAQRPGDAGLASRIEALEREVAALRDSVANLDVATLLEEREELFAGEGGRAKADELFELGQFGTAAEGYLTFLRNYPDHPDAEAILKKASRAFGRAGYHDKAIWVWADMIEAFPESRGDNLATLARMELSAKRYDDAVAHATEAAELASTEDEKLWRLLYRAWYVQERDGTAAGIREYQAVEDLAASLGLQDSAMWRRAVEKRTELEGRTSGGD